MSALRHLVLWAFRPLLTAWWLTCGITGLVLSLIPILVGVLRDGRRHGLSIFGLWLAMRSVPFGRNAFSLLVGWTAPYSASIDALVVGLSENACEVHMLDRPWLRNPFASLHAVALANLGEITSGVLVVAALGQRSLEPGVTARGIVQKFDIEFLKKARGTVVATSQVTLPTENGSHTVRAVTNIRDASGANVAVFTATWHISISGSASAAAAPTASKKKK